MPGCYDIAVIGNSTQSKPRLMVVLGTRPEAVKLGMVVRELQQRARIHVSVFMTGQHPHLVDPVLAALGVPITHRGRAHEAGPHLTDRLGRVLTDVGRVIATEQPCGVVVQGDTTSALGGALAAAQSSVPVAHVEAGLRTGSLEAPWPEEAYRRMITTLASLHLAPTERAASALRSEGVAARSIVQTGNPGIDALVRVLDRLTHDAGAIAELQQRFPWLDGVPHWVLVTAHRRENQGEPLARLCRGLRTILEDRTDVGVVWPVHPSPAVRGAVVAELGAASGPRLRLLEPVSHEGFVYLAQRAAMVVTDSGGVQEEAPWLGCPALVVRELTERQEAVEAGAARLVRPEHVHEEVFRLLDDAEHHARMAEPRALFGDGNARIRIADALERWLGVDAHRSARGSSRSA